MANSRNAGPLGWPLPWPFGPEKVPGVLGLDGNMCHRDAPGTLGLNDWAAFVPTAHVPPVSKVAGKCACDRDITLDELCKCYPAQKRKRCEEFLPFLNATFKESHITTCLRKAHFLAQVAAESGELHYTAEMLPKGVTEEKAYQGYKGRGLIQLTFAANYKAFGTAENHDFLNDHRTEVEQPEWASKSAGWYWTSGTRTDLNTLADKNDFLQVTAFINGAFIGYDERLSHLKLAFAELGVKSCKTANVGSQVTLPFKDSKAYDSYLYSFAWGCWNDATSKKKGIAKPSAEERKAGYQRYLDLRAVIDAKEALKPASKKPPAHPHVEKHYGYTIAQMTEMAKAGVK